MGQPQPGHDRGRDDERSDAAVSSRPGGGRQVEQEPARGRAIGENPASRTDDQIRADLEALVLDADDFDPAQVQLLVSSGIVVMMGTVPDYAIKRRLDRQCSQIAGVQEIHDQLQVRGETLSDSSDGLRMEAPRADTRGRTS